MKKLLSIICIAIPVLLILALNKKWGDIPPVGKFIDPFGGFWENSEDIGVTSFDLTKVKGISNPVDIIYDKNKVPHIFAQNNKDAYFAQGYVTAKDRLWQMDFQTRFAAGRISEIVGKKAIELDKYQRRMGMVFGAENALKGMMADSTSKEMILAYTNGINAYIRSLNHRSYPLEYKILDFKPELWTPLKCALLLKQMAATLAMGNDDAEMSNILAKYGYKKTQDLFPDRAIGEDPIIPPGTDWNFKPLAIPQEPLSYLQNLESNTIQTLSRTEEGIGSNNWALSGERTASGYPLLANDPHLNLTLPSIWYQIQLHTPKMNVCGVSLPGAPGIIIGFNEKIAWGVTNVDADVLDFYKIKLNLAKTQYFFDGKWLPLRKKIEKIKIAGNHIIVDTVFYTHHGPIAYTQKTDFSLAKHFPTGHAIRWIAHDMSNEIKSIYLLNTAQNYDDYRKALLYFESPGQNFIFASSNNDIAITPNGKFPLKWHNQGKYILDGTRSDNDWQGWIPMQQNPTVKNPPRGFVSSGNQASTDDTYPYYINWEFSSWERGKRINQLLSTMKKATVDSLRLMQNDTYSIFAHDLLPHLLSALDSPQLQGNSLKATILLKKWDFQYSANSKAATIFDKWFSEIDSAIWENKFGATQKAPMRYPNFNRTKLLLINEKNSLWYDDENTTAIETFKSIVNNAYRKAIKKLEYTYGNSIDAENWNWGKVKGTTIMHLAKIPGFNSQVLYNGGTKNTIDALNTFNGPSWRMVVDLKPPITAYGIYPGGQSGNPGSFFYDNMVIPWSEGKLNKLVFMKTLSDTSGTTLSHFVLKKK